MNDFSWALVLLKKGKKVCRKSWASGEHLYLKGPGFIKIHYIFLKKNELKDMQEDILGEDWEEFIDD